MQAIFEIREYVESGNSPFANWFNSSDAVTAARVDKYIRRLEAGNFGSVKSLQGGVFELKIDFGPGYRVYFGRDGKTIIILLGVAANEDNPPTLPRRLNDGNDISSQRVNMALTREYKETVLVRIKRDPKFARALYAEAVNSLLEGETEEGLSILRDLVHANITFKELSRQTGFGEKALHRMLSRKGNPTTHNLFAITKAICGDLGIKLQVKVAA